jgi:hypothetical protein
MLLLIFIGVFISSFVMFLVTTKNAGNYINTGWVVPIIYAMIFATALPVLFMARLLL